VVNSLQFQHSLGPILHRLKNIAGFLLKTVIHHYNSTQDFRKFLLDSRLPILGLWSACNYFRSNPIYCNHGMMVQTERRADRIIDLHFTADNMGLSSFKFFWWVTGWLLVTVKRFFSARVSLGRSMSSKVIDFGTNRKRVCNFLLVRHSNFGPILHRFRDIADFCSHDPTPIPPLFWGAPVAPNRPCWGQPERKPYS